MCVCVYTGKIVIFEFKHKKHLLALDCGIHLHKKKVFSLNKFNSFNKIMSLKYCQSSIIGSIEDSSI